MTTPYPYAQEMEADEADEALPEMFMEAPPRPQLRPRPVATAPGNSAYQRPIPNGYVTQTQLKEFGDKVAGQIAVNSKAISDVNGRVNTLSAEQGRQTAALKKEVTDRKKQTDGLSGAVRQLRDTEEIIPFFTTTAGGTQSTLQGLLPFLLLSGITIPTDGAAPASTGGLFGGGGDTSTLLILLALSGGFGGFGGRG